MENKFDAEHVFGMLDSEARKIVEKNLEEENVTFEEMFSTLKILVKRSSDIANGKRDQYTLVENALALAENEIPGMKKYLIKIINNIQEEDIFAAILKAKEVISKTDLSSILKDLVISAYYNETMMNLVVEVVADKKRQGARPEGLDECIAAICVVSQRKKLGI